MYETMSDEFLESKNVLIFLKGIIFLFYDLIYVKKRIFQSFFSFSNETSKVTPPLQYLKMSQSCSTTSRKSVTKMSQTMRRTIKIMFKGGIYSVWAIRLVFYRNLNSDNNNKTFIIQNHWLMQFKMIKNIFILDGLIWDTVLFYFHRKDSLRKRTWAIRKSNN